MKKIAVVLFLVFLILPGCREKIPGAEISTIQDDADWSFVLLGDIRTGYDVYRQHIKVIKHVAPPPSFVMITGDLVSKPGKEDEWKEYREISSAIPESIPLYVVAGNHDVNSRETNDMYMAYTNMPGNKMYYSFTRRGVRFICLHTELPGEAGRITGGQYRWLADPVSGELAKAQADTSIESIVIFMHRPLYPQGRYKGRKSIENADGLHALFESMGKVRLVVAGHEHQFFYFKKNGIHHIISGGGGAPLYNENGGDFYHLVKIGMYGKIKAMKARVYGLDGKVIREFEM